MFLSQDDRSFLEQCQTSVIIPAGVDLSLDELLGGEAEIEHRTTLYYDESVRLIVLLDIPTCSEEKLHSYLSNLELQIDAWAAVTSSQSTDAQSPSDAASTRDFIGSAVVKTEDDPFTLVREDGGEVVLQLAWEVRLDLTRPRLRALHQSVTFLPVASILVTEDEIDDRDFLEPFTALESNVLEPLDGFPGVQGSPYLPVSRLEKFVPSRYKREDRLRIAHTASVPVPAYSVVVPRLKYIRINTSLPQPSTIASLDIDMIPIFDLHGTIEIVDVSLGSGKALSLMPDMLPIPWKSRDSFSLLYVLQPAIPVEITDPTASMAAITTNANIDSISISLLLKVDHSQQTKPIIKMSWTANVDFSRELNPSYGAPSQPLQRTNRPSSLTLAPQSDPSKTPKGLQRTSTTASLSSTRTASTNLQHQVIPTAIRSESSFVEITFVAPTEPALTAMPFSWKVLIINNSVRPVKLAIVPLPRIQRPMNSTQQFAKRHAPKASNSSLISANKAMQQAGKGHSRSPLSTAKAVVEEQVLYALHHQAAFAAPADTDLVSLTSELRIGPLGVGQCHETEVKFIAYKSGIFSVDAIRVVDLAKESESGVGTVNDIRELPEIVVVDSTNS